MKMPASPPRIFELRGKLTPDRLALLLRALPGPLFQGKYVHWDQLLHLPPPEGFSREECWLGLKMTRGLFRRKLPLLDKEGGNFYFLSPDPVPERLHEIDLRAGGRIEVLDPIANSETKDRYLISSLIEEAITSSQLEGATTTRLVAKEMLRQNRPPLDRDEQMILNNYVTMSRIEELKAQPLTPELVFEIHRMITHNTHDDPSIAGRFRRPDERIIVADVYGQVFHEPPPAGELETRLARMCDFANGKTPDEFVHPVIRSIALHFWLAYDHPFVDGNGRAARALFYWSMLRHGYWMFEFISISRILLRARSQYTRAYLYTETDENDLTYFILYQLEVIDRAIQELHEYIRRKTREIEALEQNLRGVAVLNLRQRALIGHALRHPHHRYTFRSHQTSHKIVYETARQDILSLAARGLLHETKVGKTRYFSPVGDLEKKLASGE